MGSRWLGLALASVLAGCGSDEDEPAPREVEARVAASVLSDEDCQACHDGVAQQWLASRHHSAFTNPDFARSYARETKDFCRDCHAPGRVRPAPLHLADAEAEALGVGCLDCHVDSANPTTVLTGPGAARATAADMPHSLARDPSFGTESCARCHEFAFPPTSRRPAGTMMQLTMTEHQSSAHAARSCASCHMPEHAHDFASSRADAAKRAAVDISASWTEDDGLVVELEPVDVGHAFPTGDLYRRLAIQAELRGPDGQVRATGTRYLARHFAPWRLADGSLDPAWHEPVPDERVHGPTRVEVELEFDRRDPEPTQRPGEVLAWWVDYERVDARDDLDPSRSTLAGSVRLASGRLFGPKF